MWKEKSIRLISLLILILLTAGCVTEKDEPEPWSLPVGSPMPQFEVMLTDGTVVSSADLRGREWVIVFFNTECGDCRKELPQVEVISRDCPDAGFLCIARAEAAEPIERFWATEGLTMAVAPQADRAVYSQFAESWIPRIFVFSPEGRLTASLTTADELRASLSVGRVAPSVL